MRKLSIFFGTDSRGGRSLKTLSKNEKKLCFERKVFCSVSLFFIVQGETVFIFFKQAEEGTKLYHDGAESKADYRQAEC